MYEALARKLVRLAVSAGAIRQEDEELYLFAYESLLAGVISWASLLLMATVLQAFWGAVLFMLFFIPLRSYAGGYHEGSYLKCYVLSLTVFAALIVFCPFLARTVPALALCAALAAAGVAVWLRAPVADPNKPLDEDQRRAYRRRARLLLLAELAALGVMLWLQAARELVLFAAAGPLLSGWLVVCPRRKEA